MKLGHKPTLNRDTFTILLVEDNLAEAERLQKLLLDDHKADFFLTPVKLINEAIEAIEQENFDLILLDLFLPDSKGLDTLTTVQASVGQHHQTNYPVIVVLIDNNHEQLAIQSLQAGAQDCIIKDQIERDHLFRSLRYAIARSQSSRTPQYSPQDESQFFTHSLDLLCIAGVDGYFKRLNPAWETTFGYRIGELLDLPFIDFVHPEDRQITQRELHKLLESDTPTLKDFENRYRCQDSSYRWLSWTVKLLREEGLIYAVARDITEQKLAQEALRQSESALRGYFENSLVGLVIITPDKNWIEVNEALCTLLKYSREELTKTNWTRWTHPDDLELELEQLVRIFADESDGYVLDKRFIRKDGQIVYTRISVRCIRRENRVCDHLIAVIVDISDRYHYEQQLKQAESFLKHTLNAIADPIFVKDDQHRWILINDAFCQLVGKSRKQLMGQSDYDIFSPSEADAYWQTEDLVFSTNCENEQEENLTDSDGNLHILSTKKSIFENADGSKILVGTIREITHYKHLLNALQQSQERLQLALEGSDLGLWDWTISSGQLYFDFSWTRMLGYEVDEIENNYQFWEQLLHPDDRPKVVEALNNCLNGQIPLFREEFRMRAKSGEWRWILGRGKVFEWDELGKAVRITGTHKEITERKQAEERLRLLERAIAASINGIVITDATHPDHPIVYVNPGFERMTGYSAQEVMGKNCRFLQGTDRNQPALEQLRTALQAEQECRVILRNYRKDGSFFWNEFSISPVRNAVGELTHHIGIHRDITELKQAEASLQQQVLREQLVGLMRGRIRRTLNLQEVLTTAVEEVRQFLHTDRSVIYRFEADWSGTIVVESVSEGWTPLAGLDIQDNCFAQTYVSRYQQGRLRAIDDIYNAGLEPCYIQLLERLEVKANLIIPLLQGETLWGLLIAHQCQCSRHWDVGEIECLKQLSIQLAIAIQQSTLYEQAQTEIAERKRVEESLRCSQLRERTKSQQLSIALRDLKNAQAQLVQTEKMASLGQLVAGVAHEINNPTCFIYSNIAPAMDYTSDLLDLIALYQKYYPTPCVEIQQEIETLDLDFIQEDFPKLLRSMQEGATRIQQIVLSLQCFSRLDQTERKKADLHHGLDSTLMILQNRLREQPNRPAIQVIKEFANLPLVDCYPRDLNQVFINILSNAIDALESKIKKDSALTPQIRICTEIVKANQKTTECQAVNVKIPLIRIPHPIPFTDKVVIRITDNGTGIPFSAQPRVFDPFFTTKPVGKGTGLGLSISHSLVVKKHKGKLYFHSQDGQGTEFVIELPMNRDGV